MANTNSLRVYGSRTIWDQLGAYHFCITTKNDRTILAEWNDLVYSHRDQIKEIMAEATYKCIKYSDHSYPKSMSHKQNIGKKH